MRDDWPSHTEPISTRDAVRTLAGLLRASLVYAEARGPVIRFGPAPSDEAAALVARLNLPEPGR